MTKPAARPVLRAERIRIRLIVAWYAAAMAALVMALLAVIAMAPEARLKADRERTYQRQATVITENLAASLISPGQNPSGSQRSDGLLVASPAELGAVLKTYRQLTSITVASSGGELIAAAGIEPADSVRQIEALRALPSDQFPPRGDDIATVSASGRTITAGRILEGPGREGPLLILAFSSGDQAQTTRVLLFALSGTALLALLIWLTLDQLLSRLVFGPLLKIRRIQKGARRGDWISRVDIGGSLELQRYAARHNSALDRAARLWDTITWRRRHLEHHTAEKSAEAAGVTASLELGYRFAPQRPATASASPSVTFAPTALLILIEFAVLFELMCALSEAATWLAVPFSWRMASLLACTGLGLWLGSKVSIRIPGRREYLIKFAALSLVCAAAHFLCASFITSIAGVLLPRVASGFSIAVALNLWIVQAASTGATAVLDRRIALTRAVFITLFAAGSPAILYVLMTHSSVEMITVASVLTLVVAATGLQALLPDPESPSFGASQEMPRASSPHLIQWSIAVSVLAIALVYFVAILMIELDDSGRYLSLSMFLVGLAAGISLPFSLGARAIGVALASGAICAAPSLVFYYVIQSEDARLVCIMLSPAIAVIAGCCVARTALTVPSRGNADPMRQGDTIPRYPRPQFLIRSVALSLIVSALAGMTAVTTSNHFPAVAAILVSAFAVIASRLRMRPGVVR